MDKFEKYKKLYSKPNDPESLTLHPDGKVDLPTWLGVYFLHSSGLKSRKKRLVKKRIKRELIKALKNILGNQE